MAPSLAIRTRRARAAFAALLEAGAPSPPTPRGARAAAGGRERRAAAARAAALWCEQLLVGEGRDAAAPLAGAPRAPAGAGAVSVTGLDVTLVCPHHLTVAFGTAELAYLPGERWASFGTLGQVLSLACGRLILQEQATEDVAEALSAGLGARAVLVVIEANHPCHRVGGDHAHRARAKTTACRGSARALAALRRDLRGQR